MFQISLPKTVNAVAIAAMLLSVAGCSRVPSYQYIPNADNVANVRNLTTGYRVLYSFSGRPDGNYVPAGVIDVGGTLYGTTEFGGTRGHCLEVKHLDCGTIFSISSSGKEKVLHSFGKGHDGARPEASLIDVRGTLYGTTTEGGGSDSCPFDCGTVFSITSSGAETVLHSFGNGTDGSLPVSQLINVDGSLYGTTERGGAYECPGGFCGTVFSISTSGKEKVLHSFGRGTDGAAPVTGLLDVNGTLYGTTSGGGVYKCGQYHLYGCGTVFSITRDGRENVLHSFGRGADGSGPSGIIDVDGTLYGTTGGGGEYGGGTVFGISTSGKEKVLHSFGRGTDGVAPAAGLIDANGTLYGTTLFGGTCSASSNGCGTIFSITTGGKEKVLHIFGEGTDGSFPSAPMSYDGGSLLGTTSGGGVCKANSYGCGTVFSLTP